MTDAITDHTFREPDSAEAVVMQTLHDLRVKVTGLRPDMDDHCGIVTLAVLDALSAAGFTIEREATP